MCCSLTKVLPDRIVNRGCLVLYSCNTNTVSHWVWTWGLNHTVQQYCCFTSKVIILCWCTRKSIRFGAIRESVSRKWRREQRRKSKRIKREAWQDINIGTIFQADQIMPGLICKCICAGGILRSECMEMYPQVMSDWRTTDLQRVFNCGGTIHRYMGRTLIKPFPLCDFRCRNVRINDLLAQLTPEQCEYASWDNQWKSTQVVYVWALYRLRHEVC